MATKKEITSAQRGPISPKADVSPDDFPAELDGDFAVLPGQLAKSIGAIAGLALRGGGYFGISITDDGGSCRLAVRNGTFALDKRFSSLVKLEGALAYCLRKLE